MTFTRHSRYLRQRKTNRSSDREHDMSAPRGWDKALDRRAEKPSALDEVCLDQPHVAFEITGRLDTARRFGETDENREFRAKATLAPVPKTNGHARRTTTIVTQKAIKDGTVDRPQVDSGEIKPDQEVACHGPAPVKLLAGGSDLTMKTVDDGKEGGIEVGQTALVRGRCLDVANKGRSPFA